MEYAARQFARRILLIHLALLAAVVGVVLLASREVYQETREQATRQAEQRQSILASQTAKGIESFYRSILNDLDLLRQAPQDEDETGAANLIVRMDVWEKFYQVARTANAFIAHGRLQIHQSVIHVLVTKLENLSEQLNDLRVHSRDFQ